MAISVSYPGVYVEEIPSGVRTITGVATSIAAFVGWAPKGPTDRAELVLGVAEPREDRVHPLEPEHDTEPPRREQPGEQLDIRHVRTCRTRPTLSARRHEGL